MERWPTSRGSTAFSWARCPSSSTTGGAPPPLGGRGAPASRRPARWPRRDDALLSLPLRHARVVATVGLRAEPALRRPRAARGVAPRTPRGDRPAERGGPTPPGGALRRSARALARAERGHRRRDRARPPYAVRGERPRERRIPRRAAGGRASPRAPRPRGGGGRHRLQRGP